MEKCLGCFNEIPEELEMCPYCGYVKKSPVRVAIHMSPGSILAGRYTIGKVLGYGGFGVTYIAWDSKLEQKVAIKEYLPSEFSTRMPGQTRISVFGGEKSEQFRDGMNKFLDEARRLAKFQSEDGIVKVFDCISENDTAYIVMEYLEGETLKELLDKRKTIPEEEAIRLLMPIMESLKTVHKEGIIHRDIAPDNIFITSDGTAKLIDFGAARFATTSYSRSLTVLVKPGFSPEEQYRSKGDQGPHTDVYSLAATLYKMLTGKTPPDALERRAKVETSKKDIIEEPRKINKAISVRCENAVLNALNVRIEDRTADISQFIEELNSETPVKRRYGKIKKLDFYGWPQWLKITAIALVAVIVVFSVLIATGIINFKSLFSSEMVLQEGYQRVPNVINMDKLEAAALLEEAGFNYVYGESVISEYLDKNVVISQDPESGGIYPTNSVVTLVICEGDGTDPGLLYKTEEEIAALFAENNITYTVEQDYSNTEAGLIFKIVLEDGTEVEYLSEIPEGSSVTIYVSLGLLQEETSSYSELNNLQFTTNLDEVTTPYLVVDGNDDIEFSPESYQMKVESISSSEPDDSGYVTITIYQAYYSYLDGDLYDYCESLRFFDYYTGYALFETDIIDGFEPQYGDGIVPEYTMELTVNDMTYTLYCTVYPVIDYYPEDYLPDKIEYVVRVPQEYDGLCIATNRNTPTSCHSNLSFYSTNTEILDQSIWQEDMSTVDIICLRISDYLAEYGNTSVQETEAVQETETEIEETAPEVQDIGLELTEELVFDGIYNFLNEEYGVNWDTAPQVEWGLWAPYLNNGIYETTMRWYTGAYYYYYTDASTGYTYETEYVPANMEEESPTGVSFYIQDYIYY